MLSAPQFLLAQVMRRHNDSVAAPVNSVAPSISGNAFVGETLTASPGTWSGSPTFAYQWRADGGPIEAATASTYEPVTGDIGAEITVTVTATHAGGSANATSDPTAAVVGDPVNTVLPVITGTPTVEQTLTCSTGTWTGGSLSYSYQWEEDGTPIGGATANSLVLGSAQSGKAITCVVTATNAAGDSAADSATTAAVAVSFSNVANVNSTSFGGTFAGVALGDAHADREIIVAFSATNTGAMSGIGVTIGGVTATVRKQNTDSAATGGTGPKQDMWSALVPTGTTGDIVITGTGVSSCRIRASVYRAVGLLSRTPVDTAQAGPGTSVNVDALAGGFTIASHGQRTASGSATMAGVSMDNGSAQNGASATGLWAGHGHDLSAANENVVVTTSVSQYINVATFR